MAPLTSNQGPSGHPSQMREASEVRGRGGGNSSYRMCGHPPCSRRNLGQAGWDALWPARLPKSAEAWEVRGAATSRSHSPPPPPHHPVKLLFGLKILIN